MVQLRRSGSRLKSKWKMANKPHTNCPRCVTIPRTPAAVSFVNNEATKCGQKKKRKEKRKQEMRNKERHAHACTHIKSVAKNRQRIKYGQQRGRVRSKVGGQNSRGQQRQSPSPLPRTQQKYKLTKKNGGGRWAVGKHKWQRKTGAKSHWTY